MLQTDEIGSRGICRGGIQRQIHSCRGNAADIWPGGSRRLPSGHLRPAVAGLRFGAIFQFVNRDGDIAIHHLLGV
jgi:hypothetical protein